jgi:hypothetical protein
MTSRPGRSGGQRTRKRWKSLARAAARRLLLGRAMKIRSCILLALSLTSFACGASDEADDAEDGVNDSFLGGDKADTFGITEGSHEALGVLAVVNFKGRTEAELIQVAGVPTHSAHNIITRRDLRPFTSLADLDAVPYVGPITFGKLLAYAHQIGLVGYSTCNLDNSVTTTAPVCDDTCRLAATTAPCDQTCDDRTGTCTPDYHWLAFAPGAVAIAYDTAPLASAYVPSCNYFYHGAWSTIDPPPAPALTLSGNNPGPLTISTSDSARQTHDTQLLGSRGFVLSFADLYNTKMITTIQGEASATNVNMAWQREVFGAPAVGETTGKVVEGWYCARKVQYPAH